MSGSDCKVYSLTCIAEGATDVTCLTCRGLVRTVGYLSQLQGSSDLKVKASPVGGRN